MITVNLTSGEKITRLSDYLRAEQPDHTEPASFYTPGAHSWRGRKPKPVADLVNEDTALDPLETDSVSADELDAAEAEATALKNLEE